MMVFFFDPFDSARTCVCVAVSVSFLIDSVSERLALRRRRWPPKTSANFFDSLPKSRCRVRTEGGT
jgi:hypothetical protein